jgi:hypothetical protein
MLIAYIQYIKKYNFDRKHHYQDEMTIIISINRW